jgi:hypothetical protein
MRTLSLTRVVLTAALLWGGAALAKREVKSFEAPRELSQAEIDAAKAKARNGNINSFDKDAKLEPEPVPWMAIGLAGLVFVVATPFAVIAFRNTSREMSTANTFGTSRARRGEDEEE